MHAILSVFAAVVFPQAPSESACEPIRSVGDVAGWLVCQADAHSSLLIAVGTIGLFLVGLVGVGIRLLKLRRNGSGTDERTDADGRPDRAAARIANLAFLVRRTLAKSLEEGWRLDDAPIHRRDRARELQVGFHEHEPRVEEMLTLAIDASAEVDNAVKRAADLFWDAAGGVNDMAAVNLDHHDAVPPDDTEQGYRESKSMTEDCVEILERLDARVGRAESE